MDYRTGEYFTDDDIALSIREIQVLKVGDLMGDGGQIIIIGVNIPQSCSSYKDFAASMKGTEDVLLKKICKIQNSLTIFAN